MSTLTEVDQLLKRMPNLAMLPINSKFLQIFSNLKIKVISTITLSKILFYLLSIY